MPAPRAAAIRRSAASGRPTRASCSRISRCSCCSSPSASATAATVSGAASSRSVCPVGAVSTTIRSYAPAEGRRIDLEQADQLVDAGDRQTEQRVDIFAIEPGAVFEDLAERPAVLAQPAREGARRIELDGVERRRIAFRGARERDAERVAERMGRIGGDKEDRVALRLSSALARAPPRGGLADAAFAAEENELGELVAVRTQRPSEFSGRALVSTSSKVSMSTPVILSGGDIEIGPCCLALDLADRAPARRARSRQTRRR